MTENRSIDLSVEVPGTPEEVWRTIATGPGISSWFVCHEVDERVGGEVIMDFGVFGKETATVTAWEPPHRLVIQGRDDERGGALAYEWLVEARDGGTCLVRLVNSGFGPGPEWDADYEGMTRGWKLFLQNLRLQLTHFRGQRVARAIVPFVLRTGGHMGAWAALCRAVGIATDLRAGDRAEGVLGLSGVVDVASGGPPVSMYSLLLGGPAPGTAIIAAEGVGDAVGCSAYLYLYGPRAADFDAQAWASRLEPEPATIDS